ELLAPELEPPRDRSLGTPPQGPTESRACEARAERVDREVGLTVRIDVRYERRARDLFQLRGERGGEREDVRDEHIRRRRSQERERVTRGVNDRLVEIERLGPRGKHLILRRGREREALGLDVVAPAPPGLKRDLVASRPQRPSEGDHRKGVAGVAESA